MYRISFSKRRFLPLFAIEDGFWHRHICDEIPRLIAFIKRRHLIPSARKGAMWARYFGTTAAHARARRAASGLGVSRLTCPTARTGLMKKGDARISAPNVFVVLAIGALIWPVGAHAQTTAIAGGTPANIAVAIPVTASVAARCSSSVSGTYDAPEITAGFTHDFSMILQCSSAVRVAVLSANGGLLASIATPPLGYSRLAPYDVALSLVGNSGVPTTSAACAAATLTATASAPCSFRGPATSIQGLRLGGASTAASGSYLRVSAPAYVGLETLVASTTYADTLTVTVSPSI